MSTLESLLQLALCLVIGYTIGGVIGRVRPIRKVLRAVEYMRRTRHRLTYGLPASYDAEVSHYDDKHLDWHRAIRGYQDESIATEAELREVLARYLKAQSDPWSFVGALLHQPAEE